MFCCHVGGGYVGEGEGEGDGEAPWADWWGERKVKLHHSYDVIDHISPHPL